VWAKGWKVWRVCYPKRRNALLFFKMTRPRLNFAQPPASWVPDFLSVPVSWLGTDFENSSRFGASVENEQIFTADSPHVCLHGIDRENFIFTFICHGQYCYR